MLDALPPSLDDESPTDVVLLCEPVRPSRIDELVRMHERIKGQVEESQRRLKACKEEHEVTCSNVLYSLAREFLDAKQGPKSSSSYELHWDLEPGTHRLLLVGVVVENPTCRSEQSLIGLKSLVTSSTRHVGSEGLRLVTFERGLIDFPQILAREGLPTKHVRHAYHYRAGVPTRLDEDELAFQYEYELWWTRLLDCWLRLHSAEYLESRYRLSRLPRIPKTPRLLTAPEPFMHALLSDESGVIWIVGRDETLDVASSDSPLVEYVRLNYTRSCGREIGAERLARLYINIVERGDVFVFDGCYATPEEGLEALFRLRQALSSLPR
jgi:hypothetical protein